MSHVRSSLVWLPFFMLLVCGCQQEQFRAETTWHPDGHVSRTIYQHYIPQDAQFENVREVLEVPPSDRQRLDDLPTHVPRKLRKGETIYQVAAGNFTAVAELPDHVRIIGPDGSATARLTRESVIEDLVFVTEYRWRETLNDVVTFDDMVIARREAAEILADIAVLSLEQEEGLNFSELEAWLRRDAAHWLAEAHAAYVEFHVGHSAHDGEQLSERMADIAARYGLNLRDEHHRLWPQAMHGELLEKFAVETFRQKVRMQDGQQLDPFEAREVLRRLGWIEGPGEPHAAVLTYFGTMEAAEAKRDELWTRLFGVSGPLTPRRRFRYEMFVPGVIVETNGVRLSDHHVEWGFDASQTFPTGYAMSCRSLSINEAVQQELLGRVALREIAPMMEYVDLLQADDGLKAVLRDCVAARSLTPLERHAAAGPPESRSRARQMLRLLTRNEDPSPSQRPPSR